LEQDYTEGRLDFSEMSDDELSEIVNAMHGRYSQEMVDGAQEELRGREHNRARVESEPQVLTVEAPPPVPPGDAPNGKLYSTGQIALATFLGAPLAGCLLLARNYQVLGKGAAAWQPLVVGGVSTTVLFVLALLLPENVPGTGLSVGGCIGMYYYAKQWREGAIEAHLKAGAEKGPWALVVILGIGCSVILLGLLFGSGVAFDLGAAPGERDMPVVHVRVSQAGEIELDGTIVTRGQLRTALAKVKAAGGGVLYYREKWNETPSEEAVKAFEVIRAAGVPVQMSSRPDFSDYIGPDGVPVPLR
jgi:hypothetical protein